MATRAVEHLITITLSANLLKATIKTQLSKSLNVVKGLFKTGKFCIELTKQGNVHYHIKTQDDEIKVVCAIDNLKTIKYKSKDKLYEVFGFTKIDKTVQQEQIMNYEYILKDIVKTDQILKRLKIEEKAVYDYADKPRPKQKQLIDLRKLCCLDKACDSDTEELIGQISKSK